MDQPDRPQPPGDETRPRPRRAVPFNELPAWVQAGTAVIGVVVAAVGVVLTGIQVLGTKEPTPTPIVIRAEAFITRVTPGTDEVAANGPFRNVDPASEVILFAGIVDDVADAKWLPVEATLTPSTAATRGRVDGVWSALRPLSEPGAYSWVVLVAPAGSGAADGYADIKLNGPESDLVIWASEIYRTGD